MFAHQVLRSWTKTRTFAKTIRSGRRGSKIQDGKDVLESPVPEESSDTKSRMETESVQLLVSIRKLI